MTFQSITYYFAGLSLIRFISDIFNFQCLKQDPTELHMWLLGEVMSAKKNAQ